MKIKKILFVFLVALIMRIVYAWFFVDASNLILEDQMMYIQLAQQYPSTGFLGVTSERVPGYPLLVSTIYNLFGENNMAVVMVQIFIDSLTCVIIGLIAESVISRGFLVAGLISALNLNMIVLSGMILTDTLFLFLFSLFILFAFNYLKHPTRFRLFLGVSFLCFATLVRPVSYYLVFLLLPLLIAFFVWRGLSFKQAIHGLLIYIIPIVMVFGSIHYRNYNEYNSFSFVSQSGGHAIHWVVPGTYQYSGQGSYQEGQAFARDHIELAKSTDGIDTISDNPFTNSAYHLKVTKGALIELGLLNVLHAWSVVSVINLLAPSVAYAPVVRAMEYPSFYATLGDGAVEKLINYVTSSNGLTYLSIIVFGALISLFFLILSILGLYKMIEFWRLEKKNTEVILFALFIVMYFLAITGPVVGVKYRLPLEPIMALYATYAVIYFLKNRINK